MLTAQEGNRTGYIGVKSAPRTGPDTVLKDRGGPNQGPNIAPYATVLTKVLTEVVLVPSSVVLTSVLTPQ